MNQYPDTHRPGDEPPGDEPPADASTPGEPQAAPPTVPLHRDAHDTSHDTASEPAAVPGRLEAENWQHASPMPPSHTPAFTVPDPASSVPSQDAPQQVSWPSYSPAPGRSGYPLYQQQSYPPYTPPYTPPNAHQQPYAQYPGQTDTYGQQTYGGYQPHYQPNYGPPRRNWAPTGEKTPQEPWEDRLRRQVAAWQQRGRSAFTAVRSRPEGRIAAAALVLVVILLAGVVIGGALSHTTRTPTTSATTIGASSAPVTTVPPAAQDLQQSLITTVNAVQPSVVEVVSGGGRAQAIGSGEILTTDGYIVTNDHVVDGFSTFSVRLSDGKSVSAQLVGQDAQDDLAVLKASLSGAKPIAFADSGTVQVGQFAIALGSPLGLQESVTFGIVSALNRTASEAPSGPAGTLTGLIQTSAPINPGNSGGALVDLQGRLIGIPTLGAVDNETGGAANGIGFAIPSNRVKYVSQQLISNGHLSTSGQGYLGIEGQDVSSQFGGAGASGVEIAGFANDASGHSPAQAAGLQIGDIITAVDGQPVVSGDQLASLLLSRQPGSKVTIQYTRGSSQGSVQVTLGERPVQ